MTTSPTTTYTVFDANDTSTAERGLTAVEAMDRILTDDGYEYEIRPEEDGIGFRLWHSRSSRNSTGPRGMVKTVAFSLAADRAAAEQEIALKVIYAGWPRLPEAMTDASFDAMMAEGEDRL